ncbi:MAG: preprotein translocase subunit SecY [Eubacteriales bacterium]|nr:preprotein translocase subunit SecY [Eubacteriales bacterium]
MFQTLKNAWKIPETRKKMIFTLIMLLIFRLLSYIPVPGITGMGEAISESGVGIFGLMSFMTGGSLSQFTVMGLGITPYINASIIMQLLAVVIPSLGKLQKEGAEGRKKINRITRYSAMGLAAVMAIVFIIGFSGSESVKVDSTLGFFGYVVAVIALTAGTALAIWIGERITEDGIGNGISLLIFAGIVARLPIQIYEFAVNMFGAGSDSSYFIKVPLIIIGTVLLITLIVFVDNGERRIPVQYAKRNVGRKLYGGQSTHIPIKVNSSGVMPLIFAMAFISFPTTILVFAKNSTGFFNTLYNFFATWFASGAWPYYVATAILVMAFAYFYSSITFDPIEMAKNMQQYGGFIPGIRPGKPTSDYIKKINLRVVFVGALYLTFIAVVPSLFLLIFGENFVLGSTGVMIAVSVALETTRQLESMLVMRHYKGFLD